MITVDRETWDRWNETGEWVLFRAGAVVRSGPFRGESYGMRDHPPDEFVEWAQPCETCGPFGGGTIEVPTGERIKGAPVYTFADCPNPDCLDGKRRIAVAVPCEQPLRTMGGAYHPGDCCDGSGYVTVGHVVVEWGPLVVQPFSTFRAPSGLYLTERLGALGYRLYLITKTGVRLIALPPDIDPATLVGQYALGGKVVTP